jgi:hypothetical protein
VVLPATAAVLGALVAAGPALADVTVTPTTAVQGSGENIYFKITNDGNQPISTVKLEWPADTPIAEVYPLSVDDWAPKIEMQKLSTPVDQIHGGSPVTEVPKAITWLAMPGRQLPPGKTTELSVAMGPLPSLSSLTFTLATTYPDGKPGPAMPARITLTPGVDGQAATGHSGHAADGAATGDTSAEDQLFAKTISDANRGPSIWSIGGWVVAGLLLIGALIYFLRGRHRAEEDDEPQDEDEKATAEEPKEPVAAASSKWSFKG